MDASRIAARERRVSLLAGAALTAVALGVLAFAVIAWAHTPTEVKSAPAGPLLTPAGQTQAPAVQAGSGGDAADLPNRRSRAAESGDAARASGRRAVDRIPMTVDSPSLFMPLYRRASEAFGVNWRLIASIHQQETSFSSAPGTYRGLNFARCCAGPMQFNVKNGPVSTWERFSNAYRRAPRPASYPHPTQKHPSVYDDFDAVMAAAALLRANGAGKSLDGSAWLASYHYYGHDLTGLQYADQVLARAVGWTQRERLCVQCAVDPQLAARFDAAFAAPYRAELMAAQRRARAAARAKARAKREARERARAAERRAARLAAKRKTRAREAAAKKAKAAAGKAAGSRDGNGSSEQPARRATAGATTTKPKSPSQTTAP
jgi:hypothetical protein